MPKPTESRFDDLRSEALKHGIVSGVGVAPPGAPFPRATAENGYYGLPLLKRPTWTWEVPLYFFVGGAAGAAAVIAPVARRSGAPAGLARDARWVALAGGVSSAALLTADLGRPARFLNMLRVFKRQSPMSVGAWTLAVFAGAAAASAFGDVVSQTTSGDGSAPLAGVGHAAEALAAGAGLVMTTYTGVLIGATTVPAWNRHVRMLPIHFGASALASAVSVLELLGHEDEALNRMGMIAAGIEVGTGAWIELDRSASSEPLTRGASGWITRAGGVFSGPIPLATRATAARRSADRRPRWRRATAIAAIAGALLTRIGWWAAGSRSADDSRLPLQLDTPGLSNRPADSTNR
jgi:hypothetical protein